MPSAGAAPAEEGEKKPVRYEKKKKDTKKEQVQEKPTGTPFDENSELIFRRRGEDRGGRRAFG